MADTHLPSAEETVRYRESLVYARQYEHRMAAARPSVGVLAFPQKPFVFPCAERPKACMLGGGFDVLLLRRLLAYLGFRTSLHFTQDAASFVTSPAHLLANSSLDILIPAFVSAPGVVQALQKVYRRVCLPGWGSQLARQCRREWHSDRR